MAGIAIYPEANGETPMKRLILILLVTFLTTIANAQLKYLDDPCYWKDGFVLCRTKAELDGILREHKKWVESEGQENRTGVRADLRGANLTGATLSGADLSGAELRNIILNGADLRSADLSAAYLADARFRGARLSDADLSGANLTNAKLPEADLSEADLSNANLRKANLGGADLSNANLKDAALSDANLSGTNLRGTWFEPKLLPNSRSIAGAKGFSTLRFREPVALVELRNAFKIAGLRRQEREVTFALNRVREVTGVESALRYVFFELTCRWGMSPLQPLRILGWMILVFSVPYMFILGTNSEVPGIWKVWSEERVSKKLGSDEPERLASRWLFIPFWALYFSLLSAFHFGWRELNVGNWIARMQRSEYTLRATGWVRFVSGVQSLVSVYLVALSALTYFGRPFE